MERLDSTRSAVGRHRAARDAERLDVAREPLRARFCGVPCLLDGFAGMALEQCMENPTSTVEDVLSMVSRETFLAAVSVSRL